jgi:group I intron endonuclease
MKISGIYKIESIIKSERCYIGSAVNITNRWRVHLCHLRANKHNSKKLQRHYNKYGESDLLFSVLIGCEISELIAKEQFFIDSYKPYFNNRIIVANSNLGCHWKLSKEYCIKMSERLKGHSTSDETKNKIKISNTGKKWDIERRNKASERMKGRPSPMKGKKTTDAAKLKQSIAHTGKVLSEEHKLKIGIALKGIKRPPRTKEHSMNISKGIKRNRELKLNSLL